jgi:hypothetical protein
MHTVDAEQQHVADAFALVEVVRAGLGSDKTGE